MNDYVVAYYCGTGAGAVGSFTLHIKMITSYSGV